MTRVTSEQLELTEQDAQEFMDSFIDQDADGMLDYKAFCRAMVGLTGGDMDGDGHIDDKEYAARRLTQGCRARMRVAAHLTLGSRVHLTVTAGSRSGCRKPARRPSSLLPPTESLIRGIQRKTSVN